MPRFKPVDSDTLDIMKTPCASEISKRNGYVYCEDYLMPGTFINEVEDLDNFEVYDDDIWVSSFPKSGTTWTQEMVSSILNEPESNKSKLAERFPFIDFNFLINKEVRKHKDPEFYEKLMSVVSYENLAQRPRPRYIKTHLAFELLPSKLRHKDSKTKIIYVIRNPRDTCISLYHQKTAHRGFDGTLEQFAELFIKDLVTYGPYWKHVLGYWNQRHRSNILVLTYEEMKKDLPEVLVRVSEFLDKPLTAERINHLCHHLSFDTMKNNPLVNSIALSTWIPSKAQENGTVADAAASAVVSNGQATNNTETDDKKSHASSQLLRSGKVNQWKETINDELKENFEKWEIANLKNTDFPLNYDV
ncbi:luciferin sulfotransferase-like [Planococcus citri]|uniref:luciferin sulfotransferase-like n=1 Tax=Planococcus citri TaxID=170843 RepID=UPI0031F896DB